MAHTHELESAVGAGGAHTAEVRESFKVYGDYF